MKHISQFDRFDTPTLALQMRFPEMRLTKGDVQKAPCRLQNANRLVDFLLARENDFWRRIPDVLVCVRHQGVHRAFVDYS